MAEPGLLSTQGRRQLFAGTKYLTYSLLFLNVFLFMAEELGSLQHTFAGDMSVAEFVQVFAATIDTTAWVLLLLLFELETFVLDDAQIVGWTKRSLHGVRLLCGAGIVWAFLGYCAELKTLHETSVLLSWNACAHLEDSWSMMLRLDQYAALDSANCRSLPERVLRIGEFRIVADAQTLREARFLAWTDVINALTWILVVIVLELEVRLQLRGRLTDATVRAMNSLKYFLYSVLAAAAVYFGFKGTFLDFWDAGLWLFAFVFIELNVFEWHQEAGNKGMKDSPAA